MDIVARDRSRRSPDRVADESAREIARIAERAAAVSSICIFNSLESLGLPSRRASEDVNSFEKSFTLCRRFYTPAK